MKRRRPRGQDPPYQHWDTTTIQRSCNMSFASCLQQQRRKFHHMCSAVPATMACQLSSHIMTCHKPSKISIPGTDVIPVPLFNVLDGKNPHDYIARVEPSSQGGRKVAEYLLDVIDSTSSKHPSTPVASQPIEAQYMGGR